MKYTETNATVGGVVASLPQAAVIFRAYGIDFCCGGHRPLADAIETAGADRTRIFAELARAEEEKTQGMGAADLTALTPAELSAYIENRHHTYLRENLPVISDLLAAVLRAHGANHRELFDVFRLYGVLRTDLEQHLVKEEAMLFPGLAAAATPAEATVSLAREIVAEHEAAGAILEDLRRITAGYAVPRDACGTYRKTYQLLEELEQDLHQHIHLENNILLAPLPIRTEVDHA